MGRDDRWAQATAEVDRIQATEEIRRDPAAALNEQGALRAELNNLRKLYTEAVARLRRTRKRVRNAEFFHAREAAQMLDGLASDFERAYEKHLTGANAEATAILQEDTTEEPLDE
jgi:hypothetical protein